MSLLEAYTRIRIMETNDNYARADAPLNAPLPKEDSGHRGEFYDDRDFWAMVFSQSASMWGHRITFNEPVAFSEWVARVPGLFWKPESQQFRQLSPTARESVSAGWVTFTPWGKSQKVMGGIGTLRLAPAIDGTRLVTLTSTFNASAGVPTLIFPAVWDKITRQGPCEGRALRGQALWQPMAEGWANRFKSTRGLPRGYLVIDNPDAIDVLNIQAPVQIHPFTVMEYYAGSKELFDYVYATADTGDRHYRRGVEEFFNTYKDAKGRHGRYLLSGDMVDALWEAEYDDPADLRRTDPSAESQLVLLEARVRGHLVGSDTVERLLEAIASTSQSIEDVRRLSADVGIPASVWHRGGSLAEGSSQFMAEVVRQNKLEELVEAFALQYPKAVK